jgi:hypothetical protein
MGYIILSAIILIACYTAAEYDWRRNQKEKEFPKPPKKLLFWDRNGKLDKDSWEKL